MQRVGGAHVVAVTAVILCHAAVAALELLLQGDALLFQQVGPAVVVGCRRCRLQRLQHQVKQS